MVMRVLKKWRGLLAVILFGAVSGATAALYVALVSDLPEIQGLEALKPPSITRVYSSDGVVLSEWFSQRRDPVSLEAIPNHLRQAIIATEDQAFYSHSGVVIKGLLRAVVHNIQAGRFKEGASTITQQLAKTLFLSPEKTLSRKIKEALLAVQLERRYTKDEILELYLNQVYYGSGAYGVREAARRFFGKDLGQLTLAECALIAGMPQSPSRYSPLVNPERAKRRRNVVLSQMAGLGWISPQEFQEAASAPVATAGRRTTGGKAPYFVAMIRQQLEEELGDQILYHEGVTVHASLNWSLQQHAEQALQNGVDAVEQREGLAPGTVNGALVCLDVSTGEILALAGGVDYSVSPYDRASVARRQPGSAFKPFVYACALEQGLTQSTLVLDEPVVIPGDAPGVEWTPENYSEDYMGEISLRRALAHSRNIPAARLIQALSPSRVAALAHSLGIRSELKPYPSLALGSSEVTLLELTGAYAAFPNRGQWTEPHAVVEVAGRRGQVLFRPRPEKRAVLSEQGAAVLVNMLEAVIQEGSARAAKTLPGPLAGKTGTTSQCKDALFVGFSPDIVAGVWVGRDDGQSLGRTETGAKAALPIWMDFMKQALAGRSVVYFPIPDGVMSISVDPVTGRPAPNGQGVRALFVKGAEPRQGKPASWLPEKIMED